MFQTKKAVLSPADILQTTVITIKIIKAYLKEPSIKVGVYEEC